MHITSRRDDFQRTDYQRLADLYNQQAKDVKLLRATLAQRDAEIVEQQATIDRLKATIKGLKSDVARLEKANRNLRNLKPGKDANV